MKKRIFLKIVLLWLISIMAFSRNQKSEINLYILQFDNINNNSEINWLKEGFPDLLISHFKNIESINCFPSADLDNDFEKFKETKPLTNFILSAKYKKEHGNFIINLQLSDLTNWNTIGQENLNISSGDLAIIVDKLNTLVENLVINSIKAKKSTIPADRIIKQSVSNKEKDTPNQISQATRNISKAIDLLLNPPEVKDEPDNDPKSQDIFSLKINNHIADSRSFQLILNKINQNPYQIEIDDPVFKRDPLNHEYMIISFNIAYRLKRNIIKEMLNMLPCKQLETSKYSGFYFPVDNFIFNQKMLDQITSGLYKTYPVITLLDEKTDYAFHIFDIPKNWNSLMTKTNIYNEFFPLYQITVAPDGVKLYLNKKDLEIPYSIKIPVNNLINVKKIDIKMLSEDQIINIIH